jgi:hypothetical protein
MIMANGTTIGPLVARMSALKGSGDAEDWLNNLGEDIAAALRRSPNPAALVDAWVEQRQWRPTPKELYELEDQLREDRAREGDGPAWAKGCPECVGGWRTVLTLRRIGGDLVNRETKVACDCPRGERIATGGPAASPDRRPILNWRQAHHQLSRERCVTRDSGDNGLIGWQMTDGRREAWRLELLAVSPRKHEGSPGAKAMLSGLVGRGPERARPVARAWQEPTEQDFGRFEDGEVPW